MCLAIPGRIVEVNEDGLMRMGRVDFGGVTREVCLAYVPEAQIGDYVIVHVGFAISQLDEDEAQETIRLLVESGILGEEPGTQLVDWRKNSDRQARVGQTLLCKETLHDRDRMNVIGTGVAMCYTIEYTRMTRPVGGIK
jgi:hydrogenase expression/formation protein HypC